MRSKFENEFSIKSFNRQYFSKEIFAYDLAYDLEHNGDISNKDVIRQRISTVLTTIPSERFFNNEFGTRIYSIIFNNPANDQTASTVLDIAISDILNHIDQITVNKDTSWSKFEDTNSIILHIDFQIKDSVEIISWEEIIYF